LVQRLGQKRLNKRDMALASNEATPMTSPAPGSGEKPPALTVLYDGACPLCRREISVYRGLSPLRPDTPVCFADVSDVSLPLPAGTTRDQLLARFHVQSPDGRLLSGAQAFLALWSALPGWRWLARLGRLPAMAWTMEQVYCLFLRYRPQLQGLARRFDQPGAKAPTTGNLREK
jgi:predicted DCC family thiol-disulfide oxidoreductase YuxK